MERRTMKRVGRGGFWEALRGGALLVKVTDHFGGLSPRGGARNFPTGG